MIPVFRLKFHGSPKRLSLLTRWPDLNWFSLCQHLLNSARNFESIGSPAEKHQRRQSEKRGFQWPQNSVPFVPQDQTSQKTDSRRCCRPNEFRL